MPSLKMADSPSLEIGCDPYARRDSGLPEDRRDSNVEAGDNSSYIAVDPTTDDHPVRAGPEEQEIQPTRPIRDKRPPARLSGPEWVQ